MRATATNGGLTIRAIAGSYNVLLGIDLADSQRKGCLGFSIRRTLLAAPGRELTAAERAPRWLPNTLRFPEDTDTTHNTTDVNPLQKFRWGDYTAQPGYTYRYEVTAQYGVWNRFDPARAITVSVEVTTEDPHSEATPVFFNRGAAASQAFTARFPQLQSLDVLDPAKRKDPAIVPALAWLSRGLEEALLAYLGRAEDESYALHAAIYEFQKPELLAGLKAALGRNAEVKVAYHHRRNGADDDTFQKNDDAIARADADGPPGSPSLAAVCKKRDANPSNAIMHDKFVVLLKEGVPQAVWTGSTNWTDGGIYGQLNVGHAVYDPAVAAKYESLFQLLYANSEAEPLKQAIATLTPVPSAVPAQAGVYPIFSPQHDVKMLELYAAICAGARCLLVCAPFELDKRITKTFETPGEKIVRFILMDKENNIGPDAEVNVIRRFAGNQISVAAPLSSPLYDAQHRVFETRESFRHRGVHIHSKIILADPFGDDPILLTGSANYSANSTLHNDSNSLLVRGITGITDIYATEFMRMYEHYHLRGSQMLAAKQANEAAGTAGSKPAKQPDEVLSLAPDDTWTNRWYTDPADIVDRQLFAGTLK